MWDWQLRIPLQSINFCIIPLQYIFCSDNGTSYVISHSPKMVSKGESKVRMNPRLHLIQIQVDWCPSLQIHKIREIITKIIFAGTKFFRLVGKDCLVWRGFAMIKRLMASCAQKAHSAAESVPLLSDQNESTPAAKWEILENVGLLATYLSISSIAVWSRFGLIWSGDPGTMKDEWIS